MITIAAVPVNNLLASGNRVAVVVKYVVMPIGDNSSIELDVRPPWKVFVQNRNFTKYIFRKAYVEIVFDPSSHVLNFSVELVNGTKYLCRLGECDVVARNVSLSYNASYVVRNHEILDRYGRWLGPFPYLVSVDLKKPTLAMLFAYIGNLGGCLLPSKVLDNIVRMEKVLGMNLTIVRGSCFRTLSGAELCASGENTIGIVECADLSLVTAVLDPFAKVERYSYGNASVEPSNMVKASFLLGKNLVNEVIKKWGNGSVVGKGIAVVPSDVRVVLLMNGSAIPRHLIEVVEKFTNRSLTGLVFVSALPWMFRGYLLYHASGFLVYAHVESPSMQTFLPCMFLAPAFDLQMEYCHHVYKYVTGGHSLYLHGKGIEVRLIEASGFPNVVSIVPKPSNTSNIYLVVLGIGVALTILILLLTVFRVRKVAE